MAFLLCQQYYEHKNLFPDIPANMRWVSCIYQESLSTLYPSFDFQSREFQQQLNSQIKINSQDDEAQDLKHIQTWLPKIPPCSDRS